MIMIIFDDHAEAAFLKKKIKKVKKIKKKKMFLITMQSLSLYIAPLIPFSRRREIK